MYPMNPEDTHRMVTRRQQEIRDQAARERMAKASAEGDATERPARTHRLEAVAGHLLHAATASLRLHGHHSARPL